ncbi:MAG: DUF3786 domain-containing protein [Treponema sp.]|nr:DUF3786 domain-containing protein [Treponema sp.]
MTDNKSGNPLRYYQAIYRELDPGEIAQRCGLEFNRESSRFSLRVLGTEHTVPHPEFALLNSGENEPRGEPAPETIDESEPYEKILFLRYLCEGKYFPSQGKRLSYNEIPWGSVYYRNFEGRCLKRCARVFGKDIQKFVKMIEDNPNLHAEALNIGDASYRLEFINGLYITVILWGADDEFQPSAQLLFDDNFVFAFTAEDIVVAAEVLTDRLKKLMTSRGEAPH